MDTISQLSAALAGRYSIEREIGRGGMATVYLARDLRHDRQVALKLLDPELGAVLGVERFLSEISVTARLQHPNLLPLFDSGEAGGLLFYVMPFVEGESLRAKLTREKQLPVDEAVRIAVAVANALDYAHGLGVIHRDLKPENILLQHGQPVVADFGIALAVSKAGGARITQTGLSLGTPQYMSPEQATGDRAIDGRTDIYSLGAVAYEMLAGEPPHTGSSAQSIIAKLLTDAPRPITALRRTVPAHVDAAVRHALEKLPADRWKTPREFAEALSGARPINVADTSTPNGSRASRTIPWVVAGVSGAAACVMAIALASRRAPTPDGVTLRFPLAVDDSQRVLNASGIPFALSADGRQVVYVGSAASGFRLYVRRLDGAESRPVPQSEGATQPSFSPDGNWVVFINGNQVMKARTDASSATPLLSLGQVGSAGMDWVVQDTILASIGGALLAIPTAGGSPAVVARPDTAQGETMQWGPHVMDSRFIAYITVPKAGITSNTVSIFDRRRRRSVLSKYSGTTVLGGVDGRVIWLTNTGAVMAARVDDSGALGTPEQIAIENLAVGPGGAGKASMSVGGSLIYRRGLSLSQLVLVDERGLPTPFLDELRIYRHPRWSPDGAHVAVTAARPGGADIWLIDTRSKSLSKLTTNDATNDEPSWTADSKRVAYFTDRSGAVDWIPIDGTDTATVLLPRRTEALDVAFSRDSKWIVFRTSDPLNNRDIYYAAAPTPGGVAGPPQPFANVSASEVAPGFSPDNHWVVYSSDETGRSEVFVRPFPGPGGRVQISGAGGLEPRWSPDGRTIFYRSGRSMMAAEVSTTAGLSVVSRRELFAGNYTSDILVRAWDLAPDARHFLMLQSVDRQVETIIVYGWANELRRAWRH